MHIRERKVVLALQVSFRRIVASAMQPLAHAALCALETRVASTVAISHTRFASGFVAVPHQRVEEEEGREEWGCRMT
jgi:hypothetical protein